MTEPTPLAPGGEGAEQMNTDDGLRSAPSGADGLESETEIIAAFGELDPKKVGFIVSLIRARTIGETKARVEGALND